MSDLRRQIAELGAAGAGSSAANGRIDMALALRGGAGVGGPLSVLGGSGAGSGAIMVPEEKWRQVKESTLKVEQHLALEVRRRMEGHRDLLQTLDARCQTMVIALEKKVADRLAQAHHVVDMLTKKVDTLSSELAIEREKNVRLTQELRVHAQQGLSDVKHALDQETKQRLERETLLSRKLQEDIFRLEERIDVEHHTRDAMTLALRQDIDRASKERAKADERLLQQLRTDLATLKSKLLEEAVERQRTQDELTVALSSVVDQVKGTLRGL